MQGQLDRQSSRNYAKKDTALHYPDYTSGKSGWINIGGYQVFALNPGTQLVLSALLNDTSTSQPRPTPMTQMSTHKSNLANLAVSFGKNLFKGYHSILNTILGVCMAHPSDKRFPELTNEKNLESKHVN